MSDALTTAPPQLRRHDCAMMRKLLNDRLFVGIILLQVAMFGLLRSDRDGDSLSARSLTTAASGSPLAEGRRLPEFAAFDAAGRRTALWEHLKGQAATVVFTDCSCSAKRIDDWLEAARSRKENAIVFARTPPAKLASFRREIGFNGPLFSMRAGELASLNEEMPVAVHLSSDGTVLAIERQ